MFPPLLLIHDLVMTLSQVFSFVKVQQLFHPAGGKTILCSHTSGLKLQDTRTDSRLEKVLISLISLKQIRKD